MTAAVFPAIEEARELARRGNLIPVYREVLADLETPVSVYLKIARGRYSFLLESVEGGERLARYSFLGTEPRLTATLDQGVATVRRAPGGGGRRGLASRPLGPVVPPLGPVAGREPWPGAPQ